MVGVVLVVAAGAAAYVAVNLDAYLNENRAWLEAQAEAVLERPVELGPVSVELGLGVAVRIEDVVVAEDPAFGSEPAFQSSSVEVGLRAWPALFGRYEISHVDVASPVIRVVRTEDGISLTSLGEVAGADQDGKRAQAERILQAEEKGQLATPPGGGAAARLVLGLANIDDGRVLFTDRTTTPPLEIEIGELYAVTGEVKLDQPVTVEMRAELLKASGLPPDIRLDGPVSLRAEGKGMIDALTVTASVDASGAAVGYADAFAKPADTPLVLTTEVRPEEDAIRLESGLLQLAGAAVGFVGVVSTGEEVAYDLHLQSQDVALAGLARVLPALSDVDLAGMADVDVEVAGESVNGTVTLQDFGVKIEGVPEVAKLSAPVTLDGDRATLPTSRLELGGSPVDAALVVDDFGDPLVTFDLAAEAMRAESLALADPAVRKPEVLRDVKLDGTYRDGAVEAKLASGEGSLRDFDYRDLRANLAYRDGVATITNGRLRAFDGDILLSGRYDTNDPAMPGFDVKTNAQGVRLEQYLAVRFPTATKVIEGRLSGDIALSGKGAEWDVIKQFLTGDGTIELEAGVIHGVNLADGVLGGIGNTAFGLGRLVSAPLKAAYPVALGEPNTKFRRIAAKLEVRDGRIATPNLRFRAKDYVVRGDGGISLDGEVAMRGVFVAGSELTQDLVRAANPVRRLTGRSGQLEIPFEVSGPATDLEVRPDVDHVTRSLTTGLVTDTLGQLLGGRDSNKKKGKERDD